MDIDKPLSYSDYKRFRSVDIELWSEEDIAKFFFFDFFNAVREITGAGDIQEPADKEREYLIQKYIKYKPLFYFLDKFFLKLYVKSIKKSQRKKILFQNSKYPCIILEAKKNCYAGLIVQGKKDRFFAIKNFMGYVGVNDLELMIFDYLKDGKVEHFRQLAKETENRLKIANPDYIVLIDDVGPIAKAIALASRKLGITTLVIQRGIYDTLSPLLSGDLVADYVLVWGKYSKEVFLKEGARKPEDIYILGYPHLINKCETTHKKGKYTLCYLAQNAEIYNKDFLAIKLETVNGLSQICKKLGVKFIYRPHPREDRKMTAENLPGIEFTPKKEKLGQTFDRADIFVSFSSTALVEAAMRSKISLQLMNHPVKSDNFEQLGICSKTFQTIGELENYLKKIVSAPNPDIFKPKFNNDYIETRYNPGKRLLEIIKDIENKKL